MNPCIVCTGFFHAIFPEKSPKKRRHSTRSRVEYRLSVFNCCPPHRSKSSVGFLHVFHILENITEIKCSEVVLRSLRPADHLDTAVFLEKKLRAL